MPLVALAVLSAAPAAATDPPDRPAVVAPSRPKVQAPGVTTPARPGVQAPDMAAPSTPATPNTPVTPPSVRLPGIIGKDDRVPFEPTEWPFTAIGRVNREAGGFCTGTLVAPDRVLTAAHCLLHPRTRIPVPPHTLHFVAGYRRGEFTHHARVTGYEIAPGYVAGRGASVENAAHDWAVVRLERPLDGVRPVPVRVLGRGEVEAMLGKGGLLRAGYSQDRAHLPMKAGGCGITGIGNGNADLLLHDCDATRGDSGSAVLAGKGADVAVVAVQIGVTSWTYNLALSSRAFADAIDP